MCLHSAFHFYPNLLKSLNSRYPFLSGKIDINYLQDPGRFVHHVFGQEGAYLPGGLRSLPAEVAGDDRGDSSCSTTTLALETIFKASLGVINIDRSV